MEQSETRIYGCPMCGLDTPHTVSGQRNAVNGIRCSNCGNGSLVRDEDLALFQARWEEELREIVASLESPAD